MAKLGISTGTIPNDNTGDSLIVGAIKINSNFDEIYTYLGAGSTDVLSTPIWTTTSIGISTLRNVGVGTTNPTSALTVLGNGNFTGVVTASSFSGSVSNASYADNAGIATYSPSSGISTLTSNVSIAETTSGSNSIVLVSGATLGTNSLYIDSGLTYDAATNTLSASTFSGNSTYAINAGISTYSTNSGISTYSATSGISTYTINAGISTDVVGGIASISTLSVSGVATFSNGPLFVGSASSTGTDLQPLQVTGGAYVSENVGIGTTTPTSKLTVDGDVNVSGIVTATNGFISVGNTTPIQISLVGNQLTFTAVGIGSTTLILA